MQKVNIKYTIPNPSCSLQKSILTQHWLQPMRIHQTRACDAMFTELYKITFIVIKPHRPGSFGYRTSTCDDNFSRRFSTTFVNKMQKFTPKNKKPLLNMEPCNCQKPKAKNKIIIIIIIIIIFCQSQV
jgi:hypothetical protein